MKISIAADFGMSTRKATAGRFTFPLLTVLSWILCGHSLSSGASELLAVPFNQGDTNDWLYLDNGQIRLGVKKTSGCAIGYFSAAASAKNLLNNFDRGRFVQQSYYGDPDGSFWAGKPWRWNPVQGGGWQGGGAKLLELTPWPWQTLCQNPGCALGQWRKPARSHHGGMDHPQRPDRQACGSG
jgi:hypothetical protein